MPSSNQLAQACENRDYEVIIAWIQQWHEIGIAYNIVKQMFEQYSGAGITTSEILGLPCGREEWRWSGETWASWIKNRLLECGLLSSSLSQNEPESICTAVLHVFPLNYDETPEMLERLRNETTVAQPQVARTKFFTSVTVPKPLGRIEGLVT